MAGRGPAPKPDDQRRRRNTPTVEETRLVDDGQRVGPTITKATGRSDWSPYVKAWFETWRTSPQAKAFLGTDWQRLAMLVLLVAAFELDPKPTTLAEIRQNEERLGATVVDRQRARMKVERDDAPAAPVVALATSRREDMARRLGSQ